MVGRREGIGGGVDLGVDDVTAPADTQSVRGTNNGSSFPSPIGVAPAMGMYPIAPPPPEVFIKKPELGLSPPSSQATKLIRQALIEQNKNPLFLPSPTKSPEEDADDAPDSSPARPEGLGPEFPRVQYA